jgi:hypothetical protein
MDAIKATEISTAACPVIHIEASEIIHGRLVPHVKRLWLRDPDVRPYTLSLRVRTEVCDRLWGRDEGTTIIVHVLNEDRWLRVMNAVPIERGINTGYHEMGITLAYVRLGFLFSEFRMWV